MTHTLLVCRCMIKYYTCEGVHLGEKITLRCTACRVNYNYANYGEKHGAGFQYYTPKGDQPSKSLIQSILIGDSWSYSAAYSVSKINTYIFVYLYSTCLPYYVAIMHAWFSFWVCTSDIFLFLCSNHLWVSFQGFAESYNDAHGLPHDLGMEINMLLFAGNYHA